MNRLTQAHRMKKWYLKDNRSVFKRTRHPRVNPYRHPSCNLIPPTLSESARLI
jgi:hypothetical protein